MSRSRLLCLSDAPGGSSPSLTSDVGLLWPFKRDLGRGPLDSIGVSPAPRSHGEIPRGFRELIPSISTRK